MSAVPIRSAGQTFHVLLYIGLASARVLAEQLLIQATTTTRGRVLRRTGIAVVKDHCWVKTNTAGTWGAVQSQGETVHDDAP